MENPARDLSAQSHPSDKWSHLESGKGKTPGDIECPQLSLESAGLRSLIPWGDSRAQSRYSLTERCPAEKDYSCSEWELIASC